MKATLVLFTILLASQAHGNLLEGLEHHGEHGHHGDHGDHGDHHEHHGEHHGEHGEHDAHGGHGDHAHGDEHNHNHGDEHNHNHGDEHNHNHETTAINQDPFATALSSDLGGGFLSSLPANPAPAETFVAPAPVPAEAFVAPAPTSAPRPVEFVAPVQEQQFQNQNAIQFPEKDRSSASSSSGEPKQLAAVDVNGRTGTGDFPEYAVVPPTSFSCAAQETGGYFADPEAQCQVFHICLNGQNLGSFLCPNGTLFHQQYFVCDWWFNVDCGVASQSYGLNARIGVVPESE